MDKKIVIIYTQSQNYTNIICTCSVNEHALIIPSFRVACNNDLGSPFPDNALVVAHGD